MTWTLTATGIIVGCGLLGIMLSLIESIISPHSNARDMGCMLSDRFDVSDIDRSSLNEHLSLLLEDDNAIAAFAFADVVKKELAKSKSTVEYGIAVGYGIESSEKTNEPYQQSSYVITSRDFDDNNDTFEKMKPLYNILDWLDFEEPYCHARIDDPVVSNKLSHLLESSK